MKRKLHHPSTLFLKYSLLYLFCIGTIKAGAIPCSRYLSSLQNCCRIATNDSQRVASLGDLARYYFAVREDAFGDSVVKLQMMYAQQTGDKKLVLDVLFHNPRYVMQGTITRTATCVTLEATQKNLRYISEALAFAKEEGREDYTALAYANLSNLYLWQGRYSEAFKFANLAYTSALNSHNDSVQVVCGLQLGYTYMQRKEVLMAYKTFTNAYDVAARTRNPVLLTLSYNHFAALYKKLGQTEKAKEYANRSFVIDQLTHNYNGLVDDFLELGKIYEYNDYIERAEKLALTTNDVQGVADAEKVLFFYYMYVLRQPNTSIHYLNTHTLLKQVLERTGPGYIYWMLADVYLYGNDKNKAIEYFKIAEPYFNEQYNDDTRQKFLDEVAMAYNAIGNTPVAISYYEKALQLAYPTSSVDHIMDYLYNLGNLYEKQGDYKQALFYSNQFNRYKDTVGILAKEKDLALMEIDNENKKQQKIAEADAVTRERRDNIQYMGITAAVASIFVLLILVGMFKVSAVTIRIIGFFAFIFFFEFIVLLADQKIHKATHGEPYKVWLVKIVLLSVLLPLHQKLEQKVNDYFITKKLAISRSQIKVWRPRKRAHPRAHLHHGKKKKENV